MQCAAALLLEVAYQGRHTEENNASITSDIQKLMKWLRAMRHNDPVASRAYDVVRRILHNTSPVLHTKAEELLHESPTPQQPPGQHSSAAFLSPHKQDFTSVWSKGEFYSEPELSSSHTYYATEQTPNLDQSRVSTSAYDQSTYASIPAEQYRMPSTFGNPFLNKWDEGPPVVDMYNFWNTSGYDGNFPEDLSDMDLLGMRMEPQHHQPQEVSDTPLSYKSQRYEDQ